MAKISTFIDFTTKSRKRKERANWKNPGNESFSTHSLRATHHPSAQNLPRPPLQAVLQAPSIPMALPVSVLLALVMLCSSPTCSLGCELPASHGDLESFTRWSQMERVPTVPCLRDRTDFRFLRPWCTGPGLRRQKPQLLCTSCSSRPSSSSAPRALLQVGKRASWTDSSWDLISSWRTWMRV